MIDPEFNKGIVKDLNRILKETLNKEYPYSPGYNNSSSFRVKGSSKKSASGNFINNSEFIFNDSKNSFELYLPTYWRYIDEGRQPGKRPPIKPLLEWARLKGLPESYAWGAQKNIGKFGIAPTNFLDGLIDGIERHLDATLGDEVGEWLEKFLDDLITKNK